jgi:hypothetical protein
MGKMMTDKEKETMAIKMLNQGCTSRQIHKACQISPNTLVAIRRKLNGVSPPQSMHTQAYTLFKTMKPLEVAIKLGITAPEARKYYHDYLMLEGLDNLLNLCTTLGTNAVTQMKLLYQTLTRNGIKPHQYASYLRKATKINCLILEEEKLGQQNLKMRVHGDAIKETNNRLEVQNDTLKHDNEWFKQQNNILMEDNEWLKRENYRLKLDKEGLEAAVYQKRAELKDLNNQKKMVINNLDNLRTETNELALKKKQMEAAINISQANIDALREKLIEDVVLYVIESIRDFAAQLGYFTIDDLTYHHSKFENVLHYWLTEPTDEFIKSLIPSFMS